MRILYVEDEKFLAEAVIHLLKKEKIAVDHAADGEEGLELALKPNYDAIVLDIMLPKLSGLEILKTIRGKIHRRHRGSDAFLLCELVLLTHLQTAGNISFSMRCSASQYLQGRHFLMCDRQKMPPCISGI